MGYLIGADEQFVSQQTAYGSLTMTADYVMTIEAFHRRPN